MQNFIHDVKQLLKKYQKGTFAFLALVTFAGAYILLPRLLMEKPTIQEASPSIIMEYTRFNVDNRITLIGENLDHVIGVFINGVWEPDCYIITSTENQIEMQLPARYYSEAQNLDIQIETRINSDLTALSPKVTLNVLSKDFIEKPEITDVNPSLLSFSGNLTQELEIKGLHFNDESKVLIDGDTCETRFKSGSLHVTLPFSTWCNVDDITLQIVQHFNGYPSPVKSDVFYLETNHLELPNSTPTARNSQVMAQYLSLLANERYLVILSVKDDASYSLTRGVQNALFKLGLQNSLLGMSHYSYLAVLDGGNVLYETLDNDLIQYDGIIDGVTLHAESAGFYTGNFSSVQINGVECSTNQRGMNIVVYDKTLGTMVDSVCFDLFDQIKVIK